MIDFFVIDILLNTLYGRFSIFNFLCMASTYYWVIVLQVSLHALKCSLQ